MNSNYGNHQNKGHSPTKPRQIPPYKLLDASGSIPPDLLSKTAEDVASIIKSASGKQLTSHQLRRFYNDVKDIERRVRADPENFQKYWPLFSMLKAKAAYACPSSGDGKIPLEFRRFLEDGVNMVDNNPEKFKVFCLFFEAVVGFLYGMGIRN